MFSCQTGAICPPKSVPFLAMEAAAASHLSSDFVQFGGRLPDLFLSILSNFRRQQIPPKCQGLPRPLSLHFDVLSKAKNVCSLKGSSWRGRSGFACSADMQSLRRAFLGPLAPGQVGRACLLFFVSIPAAHDTCCPAGSATSSFSFQERLSFG